MRIDLLEGEEGVRVPREALVLVLDPRRHPSMRCPEEVDAAEILVPVLLLDLEPTRPEDRRGNFEVPLRELDATEDVVGEFLIDSGAVPPRVGSRWVVEELVEPRDLRGLERLLRQKGPRQDPERGRPRRRAVRERRSPRHPDL